MHKEEQKGVTMTSRDELLKIMTLSKKKARRVWRESLLCYSIERRGAEDPRGHRGHQSFPWETFLLLLKEWILALDESDCDAIVYRLRVTKK
jgi:hypothetical protein